MLCFVLKKLKLFIEVQFHLSILLLEFLDVFIPFLDFSLQDLLLERVLFFSPVVMLQMLLGESINLLVMVLFVLLVVTFKILVLSVKICKSPGKPMDHLGYVWAREAILLLKRMASIVAVDPAFIQKSASLSPFLLVVPCFTTCMALALQLARGSELLVFIQS